MSFIEYNSDDCVIYEDDRPICEMCKGTTYKDVKMILEAEGGWHLAEDAARGLGVECDGDLGHEAEQIRKDRDTLRESVEWFLQAFDMPHPASTTLNSKSLPELRKTFIAALNDMRKAATLGG